MIAFLCLTILDALALWAIIVSPKGWWWVKLVAIISVLTLNVLILGAYNSGNGWPIKAAPVEASYLGCYVVMPTGSTPGAVYLFAIPPKGQSPIIGYKSPTSAPRIYQQKYSLQLADICAKMQNAVSQGNPITIHKGHKGKLKVGGNIVYVGGVYFSHSNSSGPLKEKK